jgi:head-tail adaptor
VRAGQLDRQILIEKQSTTTEGTYGTAVVTWVPLSTVNGQPERYWAEVQDALPSRSEAVTQGLAVARNQVRIRFRYRSDVDSSMRVTVYGGSGGDQVMQIVGGPAMVGGRKELTEIVCERYSS